MASLPENMFAKALRIPVSKTGLRGATFMASLFLSKDLTGNTDALKSAFTNAARTTLNFGALHDLTTAVNMIDERMDSSEPDWILNAGTPHYGITPSPIFRNPEICPREFTLSFNRLVSLGMTDRLTGIAYNNILAVHSHRKAKADKDFRASPSLPQRQALCEENLKITEAYTIYIYKCLIGYMPDHEKTGHLSHQDAVGSMPEIAKIARLGQIFDDIRDLLIDMDVEKKCGVPTSNWLALKIAEDGNLLYAAHDDSCMSGYIRHREDTAPETTDIPEFVRTALNRGRKEIEELIGDIQSPLSRAILRAFIDNTINEGLKSSNHPDVLEKAKRRQTEVAALRLKYADSPDCVMG